MKLEATFMLSRFRFEHFVLELRRNLLQRNRERMHTLVAIHPHRGQAFQPSRPFSP